MGRRFPPPLFGAEHIEARSQVFVSLALETEGELNKSEFVTRCRRRLRKPEGGTYSESYLRRIVSTYVQLGVLRQTDDRITVWQFGRDWDAGDIDFETFLWYGLKRNWVLEGRFPEGIDGIRSMYRILDNADHALERGEIRDRLEAEYEYEFNDQGIRGYPTLLQALGALRRVEDGYVVTKTVERWRDRFRNADLLPVFQRWLKREGPNADLPGDSVKQDLAKYYIYRESGGHGKHRRLFDTFRKDYLASAAYEGDPSEPQIERADKYVEAENRRSALRDRIRSRFPEVTGNDLSGLSTDVLGQMADAEDRSELYRIKASSGSGLSRRDVERLSGGDRPAYQFPADFSLYDWQREAANRWFHSGQSDAESGIARVVTGAGKTVMALEVIRRWLDEYPDGVVTIVVPTKVLMRQWLTELVEKLNVPADEVGWAGGGHKDRFEDGRRILVSIVNSAVRDDFLAETLAAHPGEDHLLIADECHRYTGDTFSNIFTYRRTASLGLSATPLSDPSSDDLSEDDELLLAELGDIYYDLTYTEALDRSLIPAFRVNYVGFDLTDAERRAYERLSDEVADAVSEIEMRYGDRLYEMQGAFPRKLQAISESTEGSTPAISDFFRYTQERRELVSNAIGRQAITLSLLQLGIDTEQKSIVFQERIEQLEQMVAPAEKRGKNPRTGALAGEYQELQQLQEEYPGLRTVNAKLEQLFFDSSYRPVMYHSGHRNEAWNEFAIDWFDDEGFANVMLSVKALVEGVDVPSADVGIVRVSSGSVRQRIQTLGRVLRTGDDPNDSSVLYVLYARDTVDEKIFTDYDWNEQFATAETNHLVWDPDGDWSAGDWDPNTEFSDAVREAVPEERPRGNSTERPLPETASLERGDSYPGPRRGYRFSVDHTGRPFEKRGDSREYIEHEGAEEIAAYVHTHCGGGTVVVNEADHAIAFADGDAIFVGTVSPATFEYTSHSDGLTSETDDEELDDLV